MRKYLSFLGAAAVALFVAGCAGPEAKMGRGINNTMEIVRWGEVDRSIEQSSLWNGPNSGYSIGVVKGVNKTLARTGVGLYEIITAPLPPYNPVCTSYLAPEAQFPDSYTPGLRSSQALTTDDRIWFSGGTILPWLPGNRFRIFDNN